MIFSLSISCSRIESLVNFHFCTFCSFSDSCKIFYFYFTGKLCLTKDLLAKAGNWWVFLFIFSDTVERKFKVNIYIYLEKTTWMTSNFMYYALLCVHKFRKSIWLCLIFYCILFDWILITIYGSFYESCYAYFNFIHYPIFKLQCWCFPNLPFTLLRNIWLLTLDKW